MIDNSNFISLLPERWHVLSGSGLKVIAMVAMLIDHVAMVILRYDPAFTEPLITMGRHSITWYYLLRSVGRLAFPIFCFLLVEGFRHTRDKGRYALNLLIFALIIIVSEIPQVYEQGEYVIPAGERCHIILIGGGIDFEPSTVHKECHRLLQPVVVFPDVFGESSRLIDLVRETNSEHVRVSDRLSDSVYYYSIVDGSLNRIATPDEEVS